MDISQKQLLEKIRLVEWETKYQIKRYNLLTIHSLLIDQHPKFIQLKGIVQQYNLQPHPERARIRQPWVERLFNMLSQLIRIPLYQNILLQLEKIYQWATNDPQEKATSVGQRAEVKVRPTTASTKVRTHSAYSRRTTVRPTSGAAQLKKDMKNKQQPIDMIESNARVDYTKLKPGQQQFYAGIRSLHSEYEHPKKRLKQYQRKVFYEQQDNSDIEIIQIDQIVEANEKPLIQTIEEPLGQEAQQRENQQQKDQLEDPNVQVQENIGVEPQQPGEVAEQEVVEVVDRLKPRVRPYGDSGLSDKLGKRSTCSAYQQMRKKLEQKVRQKEQDILLAELQLKWAQSKGRSKTQLKRRAQSARIITKMVGIPINANQIPQDQQLNQKVINLQNIKPAEVNKKGCRPSTAFTAVNHKNTVDSIKIAVTSGQLSKHIQKMEHKTIESAGFRSTGDRYTVHAQGPKKKCFQQIMRQAEERVRLQAENDVHVIKQALAKSKISLGANKIAKSVSYNEKQWAEDVTLEGGMMAGITGMGMMKNPFIKVVKKKKKKKSKK